MEDFQDAPLKGEIRELQNPEVIEAMGAAVRAFGIKDVARRLRKNAGSLYAEISEVGDQRRAKLSLDDAIEATRIHGDATWLEMTASRLGFHLVPKHGDADKATVQEELCDDMMDLGRFTEVNSNPASTEKDIRRASKALRQNVRETEELAIEERRKATRRP